MKKSVFASLLIFCHAASATSTGEIVSMYNIGNGVDTYSYSSSANSYVSADYAYNLKGSWAKNANWTILYLDNGYISLKNIYSQNCLQFYGKGYQAVENTCNSNNADQQFNTILTSTGALKLSIPSQGNICFYSYAGNQHFYVYTDTCTDKKEYYWSLIPQLSDS